MNVPAGDARLCRAGCGNKIVIAQTGETKKRGPAGPSGPRVEEKFTPIDAEPSPRGNYTLTKVGDKYTATKLTRSGQITGALSSGLTLHTSHGVTCPNKDKFARENRGQKV